MQFAPMTVTEPAVQEWLRRIEELEQAGRFGEVDQLHDWMNVAFGRDQEDRLRPLDPRLHSRLGAMYLQGKRPNEAAREFELARRIAPRDIYVLRNLGKAYLDSGRDKDAGELIRAIEVLDAGAFVRNADNAALKARWYRQDGNLTNARRTLDEALEYNPRSYYLADLAAQVVLDQGDRDEARQSFRKLLTTVDESGEVSVWSRASALTAAVALGEDQRALALMAQLRNLHPTPAQMATIDKSLDDVAQRMDTTSLVQRLRQRAEVEGIGKSVENVTVTAGSPSKV
jgi:tetratricopeptide (TPR) repeat protein